MARPRPAQPKDQSWRREAACKGIDATMFFPAGETGDAVGQVEAAKVLCEACPVQGACLEFALITKQEYGIWGGTTEGERRALRPGRPARPERAAAFNDLGPALV